MLTVYILWVMIVSKGGDIVIDSVKSVAAAARQEVVLSILKWESDYKNKCSVCVVDSAYDQDYYGVGYDGRYLTDYVFNPDDKSAYDEQFRTLPSLEWIPKIEEVLVSGVFGLALVRWTLTLEIETKQRVKMIDSRSMYLYRKDGDNSWKIFRSFGFQLYKSPYWPSTTEDNFVMRKTNNDHYGIISFYKTLDSLMLKSSDRKILKNNFAEDYKDIRYGRTDSDSLERIWRLGAILYETNIEDIQVSGDMAVIRVNKVEQRSNRGADEKITYSRYLQVLWKNCDGHWVIRRSIGIDFQN